MSLICVAAALPLLSCRSADEGDAEVVATTTQVADIARNVAGEEVDVHGILPPSADPHDYEPRPSDATALAGADLVITSGGEVDEWIDELIESSGTEAEVLTLLDAAPATRTREGEDDPHWWQNPVNAVAATEAIRDSLSGTLPNDTGAFAENATAYIAEIRRADRAIADCIEVIPENARKLVTSHDSLGLFADRYGIEVVGSSVPALSTQAQPSSGETAELVELLEDDDVPAVFPESGLTGELEEAIADEAEVEIGDALYADSLGEDGSPGDTYLGALWANTSALVRGLSDGSRSCDLLGAP